jgi:hypothetical protein
MYIQTRMYTHTHAHVHTNANTTQAHRTAVVASGRPDVAFARCTCTTIGFVAATEEAAAAVGSERAGAGVDALAAEVGAVGGDVDAGGTVAAGTAAAAETDELGRETDHGPRSSPIANAAAGDNVDLEARPVKVKYFT